VPEGDDTRVMWGAVVGLVVGALLTTLVQAAAMRSVLRELRADREEFRAQAIAARLAAPVGAATNAPGRFVPFSIPGAHIGMLDTMRGELWVNGEGTDGGWRRTGPHCDGDGESDSKRKRGGVSDSGGKR
jgi:hypothetical protein